MKIAGIFLQQIETCPHMDPDPEEPLGVEYVLAAAQEQGHEVELFTLLEMSIDELEKSICRFNPDIVAFSVFTKHAPLTELFAERLKRLLPHIFIITGGPHPTAEPSFVLHPSIDACVLGEGELTFCQLLDALDGHNDISRVRGLAVEKDGEIYFSGVRERIYDLDSLPLPLRETRYYEYPGYSISYPMMSKCNWRPVLFSRGCTMPCEFCSSRQLWGNSVCFRSPSNVISELKYLRDSQDVNFVFFEDLTFTLNKRRFSDLCRLLEKENLGIQWACETHVSTVNKEIISLMKLSGCTKILWGIENLNDKNLIKLQKRQTSSMIQRSLHLAASEGILNWGCCIIGFPWENEGDILKTADLLSELDIHQLRLSIATPLPGCQWYKDMPKSSLNPDLSLYDTNHLVYDHPTISPARMKKLQNEVFVRFYRSTKYRNKVAKMIRNFPHLNDSFDEFLAYIDGNIDKILGGQKEITKIHVHENSLTDKILI